MQQQASIDVHLDALQRTKGVVYDFEIPGITKSYLASADNYHLTLESITVSNQTYNVREGFNDTFYIRWEPIAPTAMNFNQTVTISEGFYTPTALATAVENNIASGFDSVGLGGPVTVVFDAVRQTIIMTPPEGAIGYLVCRPDIETRTGFPMKYQSERFYHMVGWNQLYSINGYSSAKITLLGNVPDTFKNEPVAMSGSRYVDFITDMNGFYTIHPDNSVDGVLARIPLGPLGTVNNWFRADSDKNANIVSSQDMNTFRIALRDEWGLPFVLPDNAKVAVTFRLFPVA